MITLTQKQANKIINAIQVEDFKDAIKSNDNTLTVFIDIRFIDRLPTEVLTSFSEPIFIDRMIKMGYPILIEFDLTKPRYQNNFSNLITDIKEAIQRLVK